MSIDEQQLPNGWELATGNDLFEFIRGVSYKREEAKDVPFDGSAAILRAGNLQDGKILLDDLVYVPSRCAREEQMIRSGDLVIAMSSGSASVVGKVSIAHEDLSNVAFGTFLGLLRPRSEALRHWLGQYFQTRFYRDFISRAAAGVNINNLRREHLLDLAIPFPPIEEMGRVQAKIEALQERSGRAAKALEEVGPLLEQFRQSILAAAFSGRLTADWREKNPNVEPAHELLARIRTERHQRWEQAELAKYEAKGKQPPKDWKDKYEEPEPVDETGLPELPNGWCWSRLTELGYMNRGKSRHRPRNAEHLYGGAYPFVQTGDIAQSDGYLTTHRQTYSEAGLAQSRLWPTQTVCITIAANIASSAILTYPACFPDSVVGVIPDNSLCSSEYVEFFIRTAKENLERFAPSTAQKNINISILTDLAVPLPPRPESDAMVSLLTRSMGIARTIGDLLSENESELTQLNQSILAKAFRGELVPQDPNDEPASELLAQIRRQREVSGDRVQGSGRKKRAGGKGNASESTRPAKRSKRTPKAASATTPDASADTSPEPARPQRRRRRSCQAT